VRAGAQHELRVGEAHPVGQRQAPAGAVDRGRRLAEDVGDALLGPPGARLQLDVIRRHLARQQRGEEHAIVGAARLVADEDDGVAAERALRHLLGELGARHALPDDDEGLAHWDRFADGCMGNPGRNLRAGRPGGPPISGLHRLPVCAIHAATALP